MDQQDKTWHLIDAFLDFSLLSLNDYNVKLPTFTSVKKNDVLIRCQPWYSTPKKFTNICTVT